MNLREAANLEMTCKIWVFHGGYYEEYLHLGRDACREPLVTTEKSEERISSVI
jgi:hypothetical protein